MGLLDPQSGERILDLGCGTGHLTKQIADAGATVLGMDSDPAMVQQAQANYPGIGFEVKRGEVFTLIGPNGAGKTTVFNLISRIYTPTSGQILYDGQVLTDVPPHAVASTCAMPGNPCPLG